MAHKKAVAPVKRGRGRPPKDSISTTKPKATPANPPGRPPGTSIKAASSPKRGPGRQQKASSTSKATASPTKKRGRPRGSTNATAKPSGIVKRGRPPGNATKPSARKLYQNTPAKASAVVRKGGRPKGKHVSNLSSSLKTLISNASKGRLVELLSVLCERNAVVAKATSNALREERRRKEEGEASKEQHEVEKEAPEPASGYEADVEPEIPPTGTEEGEEGATQNGDGDGVAGAETETIAQAVLSVRDSAFGL